MSENITPEAIQEDQGEPVSREKGDERMSRDEFEMILERLTGVTGHRLASAGAELLGVTPRIVQICLKGDRPVSRKMARTVRAALFLKVGNKFSYWSAGFSICPITGATIRDTVQVTRVARPRCILGLRRDGHHHFEMIDAESPEVTEALEAEAYAIAFRFIGSEARVRGDDPVHLAWSLELEGAYVGLFGEELAGRFRAPAAGIPDEVTPDD